jgi:polyhydroxybutyrate depolymerase
MRVFDLPPALAVSVVRASVLAGVLASASFGCQSNPSTSSTQPASTAKPTARATPSAGRANAAALVGDRPYRTRPAPTSADAGAGHLPALVVALHGFGSNGAQLESGLGLDAIADAHDYALAIPDGTPDSAGRRFWNATDSCCNFDDKKVDDVAYLGAVIDDATQRLGTDPARVYIVGHSNGGFMALRLACDLADKITAVISLAGAGYLDASRCVPSRPVSILQVHGDADTTIPIGGGTAQHLPGAAPFASARDTIANWGKYDRCLGVLSPAGKVDLSLALPGAETDTMRVSGCPSGLDVELWTVHGGEHNVQLSARGGDALGRFLDGAGVVVTE